MNGHGWVTPNKDGSKAKCGGPGLCKECQREQLALAAVAIAPAEQDLLAVRRRREVLEFAIRPFARLLQKLELEHLPDSEWLEVLWLQDATAPAPGQISIGQLRRAALAVAGALPPAEAENETLRAEVAAARADVEHLQTILAESSARLEKVIPELEACAIHIERQARRIAELEGRGPA